MTEESKELQEARARIAQLEAELEELQSGLRLTMNASVLTGALVTEGQSASISTLEEMVMMVNTDRTVGYVNAPMARLLGVEDRKLMLGDPLARWDQGVLGAGTLGALVASALTVDQVMVVEQTLPDLPADRLPEGAGDRPVAHPTLRFVASPMKGRVQLTIQDVTRLRWLEETFSRFVSPQVIELMLTQPTEELLDMQRREISMLYADLRGFTGLSQTLPLGTLKSMMTDWFAGMQACVERRRGIVGQLVGDQVVALFGAPVAQPEHALDALLTACDMQETQRRLCAQWKEREWPHPEVGIGISTGEVAVGNLGTERMMYYTALGYWMNLGARLCSAAEGGEILTIPTTHAQALAAQKRLGSATAVPHLRFQSRGVFRFKNCREPTEVLEVIRLSS